MGPLIVPSASPSLVLGAKPTFLPTYLPTYIPGIRENLPLPLLFKDHSSFDHPLWSPSFRSSSSIISRAKPVSGVFWCENRFVAEIEKWNHAQCPRSVRKPGQLVFCCYRKLISGAFAGQKFKTSNPLPHCGGHSVSKQWLPYLSLPYLTYLHQEGQLRKGGAGGEEAVTAVAFPFFLLPFSFFLFFFSTYISSFWLANFGVDGNEQKTTPTKFIHSFFWSAERSSSPVLVHQPERKGGGKGCKNQNKSNKKRWSKTSRLEPSRRRLIYAQTSSPSSDYTITSCFKSDNLSRRACNIMHILRIVSPVASDCVPLTKNGFLLLGPRYLGTTLRSYLAYSTSPVCLPAQRGGRAKMARIRIK